MNGFQAFERKMFVQRERSEIQSEINLQFTV